MEKFVVIDGNSLINRAYYALPGLKNIFGKPCGAIYGFLNTVFSVMQTHKPKYLVCVFDAGKHTFRHNLYAEYKAGRQSMPEDLHEQLNELKSLLNLMKIPVLEIPEIEADDIVGSLSRKFDAEFLLLSGDRDLLQLINKTTSVILAQRNMNESLLCDEKTLLSEFKLKPYQVIEMKAIMGDSSDNIPGVAGIGKVGATKLIEQYDNLDNIYAHIDEITGSTKTKLIEHKDMAYLSKTLATIKLDVPLSVTLEDCEYHIPFGKVVKDKMEELGFKSILKRKELFSDSVIEKATESVTVSVESEDIVSQSQFDEMVKNLGDSFAVACDEFTLTFASSEKEYVIYPTGDVFAKNTQNIKALFEGEKQKICFDAKLLMHALSHFEISLVNYFDVSLAAYIANEVDSELKVEDVLKLNGIDTNSKVSSLINLKQIYIGKLINGMQLKLYSDIELPLVEVLFDMEENGIKVDVDQIKKLSESYHEELDEITKKIYDLAGEEFNINSPKQLQTILFDKLKIEYKGKASTSIEVLNEIADQHEIVQCIIRFRKISKLISTYLDGMLNFVGLDGKIHTTYMQRITSTGRLSSREPNLQNLPIRDDEGKMLRKMFSSSFENGSIISADYNQIELRLMANFSGDENMQADYLSGKDIHSATASKIFNIPLEQVTSKERRVAKSVNFGIIYGISAYGLSQNIHSSQKEAGEFIKKYLAIYPRVKEYGEECIEKARETGYASTLMGRVRHIPDINSRNYTVRSFAERVAKNMPLQGSASDIIKLAMIGVFKQMKKEKLKSKLILQIHDELVVDCFPGESERIRQILVQVMEHVVELKVPLLVEVSEGKTLYDAK